MTTLNTFKTQAAHLDAQYETHKELFEFPTLGSMGLEGDAAQKVNYLCGNSLGLMPKSTPVAINHELSAWAQRGVEAHFRHPMKQQGLTDWVDIDLPVVPKLAKVVGAQESEVACMGTLTMNLNSLLCAFYQPQGERKCILFEKHAFPSDYYAMLNQVRLHGYNEDALIQLEPRQGETYIRTEDILDTIEKRGSAIAVVCFSGIQYYTGQYFEIARITAAAHAQGCTVGWDLAHVAGNVDVKLHDWGVDFAAWCSYKYLNAGPGGIGGIFVHAKHGNNPRLAGWWGNNAGERFKMLEQFDPIPGALGYRQSNPSVIDVVSLHSSLDTYEKCGGITALRAKSKRLTAFLETLLKSSKYYTAEPGFSILTPADPEQRGAQLSLLFSPSGVMAKVFDYLNRHGVICDDRRPDVIRIAPVPSYNSFQDIYECVRTLDEAFVREVGL